MGLYLCREGYEKLLGRELAAAGQPPAAQGPGWVTADGWADAPGGLAFAHLALASPRTVTADSVNGLAQGLAAFFLEDLQGERIAQAWPCLVGAAPGVPGLGKRAATVQKALDELLRRRVGRVAKLATTELPRGGGPLRGLFVHLADFDRALAARDAWSGGQRRMADDPAAPSRSYLKIEEAYGILCREPQAGETVCDLGAAPGGWSYSAVRREARVVAVDNGPLKDGALGHPLIRHVRGDAFTFRPAAGEVFDWMFCDLVDEPHRVLRDLVEPWLGEGRCRLFVVNLKFGRADAAALLRDLRDPGGPLRRLAPTARVRHLFHDRDELTLVGRVGR